MGAMAAVFAAMPELAEGIPMHYSLNRVPWLRRVQPCPNLPRASPCTIL